MWCAKPLLEAEYLRCAELVNQNAAECRSMLEQAKVELWQAGYAAGEHAQAERMLDELEEFLIREGRKEATEADWLRLRGHYQQ